jgi:protein dithiol oxidoreductase (disulfide-forming)
MSTRSNFATLPRIVRALAAFALAAAFVAGAAAQAPVEGTNYARLKNPQPNESGKSIEVLEFFSYGCPHCGELEPHLQAWLKNKPADVTFRRIPVSFQPRWESLSRVFYTLDALGEEMKYTLDIFTAIHGKGVQLWNEKDFLDWAAAKGMDRKKVEDMYKSFAIAGKMNRAKQLAGAYGIQSVPTIVVDGKFTTGPERLQGGHAAVPGTIDALIAKARAERPKS